MITAALTTLIVTICAFFGVTLSVAEIGAIAVVMKVVVVSGIFGVGLRWWRARQSSRLTPPPLGSPLQPPRTPGTQAEPKA